MEEREYISPTGALDRFIDDMERNSHSNDVFNSLVAHATQLAKDHRHTMTAVSSSNPHPNITTLDHRRRASIEDDALADQVAFVIQTFGCIPPGMDTEHWFTGRDES